MYLKLIYYTNYTTNPLTYLLIYRLTLTDINIYLEYFIAQCTLLNIKPKTCV